MSNNSEIPNTPLLIDFNDGSLDIVVNDPGNEVMW